MSEKADFIIYIKDGNLYLADVRGEKIKLITKEERIINFLNDFASEGIQTVIIDDNNSALVNNKEMIVQIAGYQMFFSKYKDLEFSKKIYDYLVHNKKTANKKVTRINKNTGLKIAAIGVLAAAFISVAVSAYGKEEPQISQNSTSSVSSISNMTTESNSVALLDYSTIDFTSTTRESTTKERITQESTTREITTQEDITKELTTKAETTQEEKKIENTKSKSAGMSGYNYKNDYSDGFIVTTGNKTYSLSSSDFDLMCAVVMQEGGSNQDEALAVASVILNRCDSGNWGGNDPISVIKAKSQFSAYGSGAYQKFLYGKYPNTVRDAVSDALNGCRNNDYVSFRSYESTYYGDNMLTSNGNRYR